MPLTFTTTSQSYRANGVKVLVYGSSGIGKTMLVATLPSPILLSAESGLLSLAPNNIQRVFGANQAGISYDVPVIPIRTVEDIRDAFNWFQTSPQARPFQSIALDRLSEIAEVVLSNAKKGVKDPRQAYGTMIEQMLQTVRLFRDLPNRNVYMSCKAEATKDDLTGVVKWGPAMPGSKLGAQLPYYFDEVLRLGVNKDPQGNSYRFLQSQPDMQFDAKDRSGMLAPIEHPHLGYIFHKITGA